jgi:tRNA(Leu) C34 or U34 (ribose-2'-O)-methylase TrmL
MQDEALRSLNLSTVVGVLLYEVLRQWQSAGSRP